MYSDDYQLHIFYEPTSFCLAMDRLNFYLERISAWSVRHGFKLDIEKCTVLQIDLPAVLERATERSQEGVRLCKNI